MNGEIICVGTELLLGDIVNTNAQFLSAELAKLGINVYNQSVVGDNAERIKSTLSEALTRSDILVFTGGLGPTEDDLTKESIADFFSLPMIEDAESRVRMEAYFHRTGREMNECNYKQALAPVGSTVFQNDVGTAPGYAIEKDGKTVIILPGPPREMQYMYKKSVVPYLSPKTNSTIVSHTVHIFGEMESAIEGKIKEHTEKKNPTTAPYAKDGEIALRITAKAESESKADRMCVPTINAIKDILGDSVYDVDSKGLNYKVVELLKQKGLKIATAESCTAGLLSALITEVPGSSAVFDFGVSAYANHIKTSALGVPASIIEKYGAVSEHTASYMALGVRKLSGADIGVGITGVAGPESSENKPVGLVYIAIADKGNVWVRRVMLGHGKAERDKVRLNSAKTALDLVRRYLCSLPETMEGGFTLGSAPVVLNAQPAIAGRDNISYEKLHTPYFFVKSDLSQDVYDNYVFDKDEQEDNPREKSDVLAPVKQALGKASSVWARAKAKTAPFFNRINAFWTKFLETKFMKKLCPVLRSFLPWKGDRTRDVLSKLVFTVSLIALIVSSTYMVTYFYEGTKQSGINEEIRNVYEKSNVKMNDDGVYESFDELLSQNPHTAAWLTVPNANVDNPVVLGEDNDYYLNHNFLREKSRYGTLFFDSAAKISKEKVSQNLVIHGHMMRDGSMFGSLYHYKNINFYKTNPVITMRTLYDNAKYKIFAMMITNADKEQDNGYTFNYLRPDFDTQSQFMQWIELIRERSIIDTGVEVIEGDEILTLSTCTYEFTNARFVIFARKVRESESIKIETSLVKVNTDARYPQAYYDAKKIKNPHEKASDNLDSYTEDTSSDTYFESSSQNNLSSNEAIDREDTLAETSDMPEDTVSSDTVPDGFNTPSDYFVSSSNIASADSSQTETTN
ncbi:MAG: competence/damage-inducible protein A [Clostridia bacterium]|nr:competence/damage-inducible protein A [Clostridia bacterium]